MSLRELTDAGCNDKQNQGVQSKLFGSFPSLTPDSPPSRRHCLYVFTSSLKLSLSSHAFNPATMWRASGIEGRRKNCTGLPNASSLPKQKGDARSGCKQNGYTTPGGEQQPLFVRSSWGFERLDGSARSERVLGKSLARQQQLTSLRRHGTRRVSCQAEGP